MEAPGSKEIKTFQPPEVSLEKTRRKRAIICSRPVRIVLETLLVLIVFVPLFVIYFKWTDMRGFLMGKIVSRTRFAPDAPGFESWLKPPANTFRDYRLFNITNYMDIMTDKSSPPAVIQETSPFRYRLVVRKNNVEWLNNNTALHYSLERIFTRSNEFEEHLLNEEGAFLDVPRMMLRTQYDRVAAQSFFALTGYNAFNYSKAIDKLEGFKSASFDIISERMQGPNKDKYGFIYRNNGSNGFNYTIHTGIGNSSNKGQVIDFASEYTTFQTTANQWNATFFDGLTFPAVGDPPNRKVINLFQPDFCRPIQLRYNRTVSKYGFGKLHEYVLKLVDYKTCPEMNEDCEESDKLDISSCLSASLKEEVVFLSKPHLYGHNSSYTNVQFEPNENKHESTIYFEPITGTPVKAHLRIQLNANVMVDRIKIKNSGETESAKARFVHRFIPMLWIDQTISLNDETHSTLTRVFAILRYGDAIHRSLSAVYILVPLFSIVAIIVVLELFFWNRTRKTEHMKLYQGSEQEKALLNSTLPTSSNTA